MYTLYQLPKHTKPQLRGVRCGLQHEFPLFLSAGSLPEADPTKWWNHQSSIIVVTSTAKLQIVLFPAKLASLFSCHSVALHVSH